MIFAEENPFFDPVTKYQELRADSLEIAPIAMRLLDEQSSEEIVTSAQALGRFFATARVDMEVVIKYAVQYFREEAYPHFLQSYA